MKHNAIFLLISLLVLITFTATASDELIFRMSADDYQLTSIGDTTTVYLEAYIDGSESWADKLNGINLWQLDLEVDVDNVIEVVAGTFVYLEPYEVDLANSGYLGINTAAGGKTGNIHSLHAGIKDWGDSDAGIEFYTVFVQFDIRAIGEGTTEYSMDNFSGLGWKASLRDDTPFGDPSYSDSLGNTLFTDENNQFTVIPEPCSLLMLSLMSITGLRIRRRKK
ncbi:MAG: hypothetical protein JW804_06935 [Sedimentisphaerales bacterium]|nr:hypothetical protein [Sedimentisphaerales bacterium]